MATTQPGAMTHNDSDDMTRDINTADTFAPDWSATDIANLQPGHLARSKPVRGWERKPASPFSKQRLRVGKVWRRAALSNATALQDDPALKRMEPGQSTQSPRKVVKRLCLGANAGIGAQWDRIGSPTKRIVTRSAAADDLVALPDAEEEEAGSDLDQEEDVEGTIVEIIGEDGQALRLDADNSQDNEDWLDEDAQDDILDERFDDTMMHLGEASEHEPQIKASSTAKEATNNNNKTAASDKQPADEIDANDTVQLDPRTEKLLDPPVLPIESTPLPDGFVSPVRQKRSLARRQLAQSAATNRRRTLPKTFTPMVTTETFHSPVQATAEGVGVPETIEQDNDGVQATTEKYTELDTEHDFRDNVHEPSAEVASLSDDDAWEDVPDEHQEGDSGPADFSSKDTTGIVDENMEDESIAPTAESSSQQLQLPLRRSPRRKSSSPLKQRSFQTFVDAAPHLVAFSPIKGLIHSDTAQQDQDETMDDPASESPVMLERSVSAPPEEPQIPPRRSAKPRVSDDTALLQAFLNRAAENKTSRRLSATKRESLSNRRDSDTVRQALASPAKPEILGALDPNSPSPKKSAAVFEDAKVAQDDDALVSSPVQSSGDVENKQGRTTRRSHRDKRRVERAAPLAQTRISLRGNTDPVVLKRSEAQELATTTRANTRKNKGGSIMPSLRLTKLIVEKPPIEAPPEAETEDTNTKSAKPGRRTVQWDETLAYFQEAPSEPEVQLFELGDSNTAPKLQGHTSVVAAEPEPEDDVPAPPPAAETPSKPKVRRLRAPRTASTPDKAAAASVVPEEPTLSASTSLKLKQPKRSRIATPAKGHDASSLLPADVATAAPAADNAPVATRPKAVPRKKATSRLPAPAPVPASSHQGTSLIASPPKRKPTAGSLSTKSPAPKLDFQTKLSASSKPADQAPEAPPGLMSPAKRAGRTVAFGNAPPGPVFGVKYNESEETKKLGLGSPAKKRTRRAL